jgi:hypothetical protein
MGLRLILLFIGALGVAKAQLNDPTFGSSSPLDLYNALVRKWALNYKFLST